MGYETMQLIIDFLREYLTKYFSEPEHVMFWSLVAVALLIGVLVRHRRNRNFLKIWLKEHNIGKRYWK